MRKTGLKWYGIALPLAALVAAIFGERLDACSIYAAYVLQNALAFGAAQAFFRASTRVMSSRRVMGSLLTAILMIALTTSGLIFCSRSIMDTEAAHALAMVAIVSMVMVIEELFASQGDPDSATLTDVLSAIALSAALLLPGNTMLYAVIVSVAALIVSGAIAVGFSRHELPQPNPAFFKEIPVGLLRTALYPAVILLAFRPRGLEKIMLDDIAPVALLAGGILIELSRTPFKRERGEGAGFSVFMGVLAVVLTAAAFAIPGIIDVASVRAMVGPYDLLFILLSAISCAILLYGSWGMPFFAGLLLMLGTVAARAFATAWFMPDSPLMNVLAGLGLTVLVNVLMLGDWREVFRMAKVKRIRKKAMKRAKQMKSIG